MNKAFIKIRKKLSEYLFLKKIYDKLKIQKANFHRISILNSYYNSNETICIHLGCGPNVMPNWLNFDYAPALPNVLHFDARQKIPLESNTVDYIFCEHMIEHIDAKSGINLISECYRTLKAGGVLRLSTPDLNKICELLNASTELHRKYIEWSSLTFLPEYPVRAEFVVNNYFRAWGHVFLYSEKLLFELLQSAGFSHIKVCEINCSKYDKLKNLENSSRMPDGFLQFESVIFEAKK